jgi:hypothetical protein
VCCPIPKSAREKSRRRPSGNGLNGRVDSLVSAKPRYGIDPYLDWLATEGIPVVEDYGVYLFDVETAPWPRYGVKGAAVHLKGRGDFANMFVFDIAPGKATCRSAISTRKWSMCSKAAARPRSNSPTAAGAASNGARSLFAIPLNAKHRHFNGSGTERALLVSTTNLPMVMNVFHNERFVFATEFEFSARAGKKEYFSGEGDLITVRPGNHMWETNFVPDLAAIELKSWGDRGAGGTNIMFVLADGTMHAHISEMPVGTYKKGHRHGPSFHVMCVTGHGYSLLWFEHEKDFRRIDWKHGMVLVPADRQFHQHFNTGPEPARYLATAVGGLRYPTHAGSRISLAGRRRRRQAGGVEERQGGRRPDRIRGSGPAHPPHLARRDAQERRAPPKMEKFIPTPEDMNRYARHEDHSRRNSAERYPQCGGDLRRCCCGWLRGKSEFSTNALAA